MCIFQLRTEKGLTQKQVADQLNISNKTVSKWECGSGCPDVSLWEALANDFVPGKGAETICGRYRHTQRRKYSVLCAFRVGQSRNNPYPFLPRKLLDLGTQRRII